MPKRYKNFSNMIPAFLKEYKTHIENYRTETVRIKAMPIKDGQHLPIKASKFLGLPFLPFTQKYPINKFGRPMIMLAQINFEEMPQLNNYPSKGIFQVFTTDYFWSYGNEYFLYLYHEIVDQKYHEDFSCLTPDLYEDLPINFEHQLTFSKVVEYGGIRDFRFNLSLNGKSVFEFNKDLNEQQQKKFYNLFVATGHKIGGYAYFTQSDPREVDDEKKNDLLLLQIDTDKEIMFGDAGISNIFINADDLKNRKFDNAYFYWDCA